MEKILSILLNKTKICLVTHEFTWGAPHELFNYLKPKTYLLVFITQPFYYSKKRYSEAKIMERGKLINTIRLKPRTFISIIDYMLDAISTLIFLIKKREKFDLYIGADCLNAFIGILLRKMGLTNVVIYYSIDYVPNRFKNSLLNSIYHLLDILVAKKSDFTWNVSPRMGEIRAKKASNSLSRQIVVPVPINLEEMVSVISNEKNIYSMIYAGSLREEAGLELAIEALPSLKTKFPNLKLTIIGEGPLLEYYRRLVKEKNLDNEVTFLRYIESRSEFIRYVLVQGIGLVIYKPLKNNFYKYADVGKAKIYAACGLPIIITKGPYTADEVYKAGAGIVINYDVEEFKKAIMTLLSSKKVYETYSKNALRYAKMFSYDNVYEKPLLMALAKSLFGQKLS
jgi:glycosyltransferase involved in cell wall biosynthesis